MTDVAKELAELLRLSAVQTVAGELARFNANETVAGRNTPDSPAGSGPERTITRDAAREVLSALQAAPRGGPATSYSLEQIASVWRNQAAQPNQSTSSKSTPSETPSSTSTVVKAVLDGMGVGPILRGLLSLFGGGGEEPTPALSRYSAPAAVRLNAAVSRDSTSPLAVDYDQNGQVREVARATPSVVVNVSAMDTQSFLDRSDDIARAVKQALLESHSLNDVIAEI